MFFCEIAQTILVTSLCGHLNKNYCPPPQGHIFNCLVTREWNCPLKGKCFIFTEVHPYFGSRLTFYECNSSVKTMTHGLTECLIHCYDIPQSLASN